MQSLIDVFSQFTLGGIKDVGLGESWDAIRLREEVCYRAATLSNFGISRGSVVAINHGGTAHFFADLLGIWRLGATAACLDPALTASELRNVVKFSKSRIVLTDGASGIDNLDVPTIDLARNEPGSAVSNSAVSSFDDPALLLFTSGTTGTPKGVVLSFGALVARLEANLTAIDAAVVKRALVSLPTHFGHGLIGNALTPLLSGGDIVLHPLGIPMANYLGQIIDEHEITFMSSVPTLWRLALPRSAPPLKTTLLRVHVGSAPFPAALWSQVVAWSGAEVVNCYGTTETANWIAGASSRADGIADGLIGRMWGGSAAVIDDAGHIRNTGDGEILIRSPSFMSGYLDRPDLTRAALHESWYRTGDRGSIDQDGRLWLTGRIKDEINRAGFKVQPAEIDTLLGQHPAIEEACVFGIGDPLGGEAVAVAIRLKKEAKINSQELQAWCLERVRREAVPERWFFVSEIPRTGRGKVSRDVVRRTLVENPAGRSAEDSKEPLDHATIATAPAAKGAVEHAWMKVFGQASLMTNSHLADTGGDSLDAMRLWLLIEQALGTTLLMDVLDTDPTPSELVVDLQAQLNAVPSGEAQLVFLMTPAEGDSPGLAHFRAALRQQIRFNLIVYPDWRNMIDSGSRFETLVETAVEQICKRTDADDACYLAGYSFGGYVAVETARRLAERGRRINFLGLIDTRTERPTETKRTRKVSLTFVFVGKIISALILLSAFRPLKLIGEMTKFLSAKSAFTLEFMLNARLRTRSLSRLHLSPMNIPVTLFRSDEGPSTDNGWSTYCSQLTIIPIGGDHHSILTRPHIDLLSTKFLESIGLCRSDAFRDPLPTAERPASPDETGHMIS